MSPNRKFLVAAFYLILLIVVVLFVIVTFLFIIYLFSENHIDLKEDYYNYQQFSLNPHTNETYFGMFTSYQPLLNNDNEFLSYQDEDGRYNLISKFGNEEYQCFGTCYCDNNEEGGIEKRRVLSASTIPLVRGLPYFVAAVTSYLAFDYAKHYFDEECQHKLSQGCPESSIRSEVEKCEMVYDKVFNNVNDLIRDLDEELAAEKEKVKNSNKQETSRHFCEGFCIMNAINSKENSEIRQDFFKRNKAGFIQNTKLWWFLMKSQVGGLIGNNRCSQLRFSSDNVYSQDHKYAKIDFMHGSLHNFCLMNSEIMYTGGDWEDYKRNRCGGYANVNRKSVNPSIRCRKL